MRRVYDDTMYHKLASGITSVLYDIERKDVERYGRSVRSLILDKVFEKVSDIKLGKNVNTTGIGNNWKCELIYTGNPEEEQIFGILHMTDNMYGAIICWMSDIDEEDDYDHIRI